MDVSVGILEPRQAKKVEYDLSELLVIAVCGVLAGAGDTVGIAEWVKKSSTDSCSICTLNMGFSCTTPLIGVFATIGVEAFVKPFAVIASERIIKGRTTIENRFCFSSLPADAACLNRAVRQYRPCRS